jgi:hypothetical protein
VERIEKEGAVSKLAKKINPATETEHAIRRRNKRTNRRDRGGVPFEVLCDHELSVLEQVSQHRRWLRMSWETADNFLQDLEHDLKTEDEP